MHWLERFDPDAHRRIKGLRLVVAFALATMAARMPEVANGLHTGSVASALAGGFALWASVSEARATRWESSRDLTLLCSAAALGAISYALASPELASITPHVPDLILATGAFCVGYLRRFGVLGAGVGSQIFIGQLLAYGAHLGSREIWTIAVAGVIAAAAAVAPRLLSGPAEKPASGLVSPPVRVGLLPGLAPETAMGIQAAAAALAVIGLTSCFGLIEPAWGITAVAYVISGSSTGTLDRVLRRIFGTAVGVPLGLVCLPIAGYAPLLLWFAAAAAMIVYAMALPERYDIASGAFAFTLVITLAANGEHSIGLLFSRVWETVLGGALGLSAAYLILPLRAAVEVDI